MPAWQPGWRSDQHEAARVAAHAAAGDPPAGAVSHQLAAARQPGWLPGRRDFDFFRQAAMTELAQVTRRAFDHWFDNADAMPKIGSPSQMMHSAEALALVARNDVSSFACVRARRAAGSHGQAEVGSAVLCALLVMPIALATGASSANAASPSALRHCRRAFRRGAASIWRRRASCFATPATCGRAAALARACDGARARAASRRRVDREHERVLPLLLARRRPRHWTVAVQPRRCNTRGKATHPPRWPRRTGHRFGGAGIDRSARYPAGDRSWSPPCAGPAASIWRWRLRRLHDPVGAAR